MGVVFYSVHKFYIGIWNNSSSIAISNCLCFLWCVLCHCEYNYFVITIFPTSFFESSIYSNLPWHCKLPRRSRHIYVIDTKICLQPHSKMQFIRNNTPGDRIVGIDNHNLPNSYWRGTVHRFFRLSTLYVDGRTVQCAYFAALSASNNLSFPFLIICFEY